MRHVCGLDVHKDSVFVCILNEKGVVFQEKFGVLTPELERMVGVIMEHGVTEVGMESTSVYWMPVWRVIDPYVEQKLVNPYFIRQLPGKKSDVKDAVDSDVHPQRPGARQLCPGGTHPAAAPVRQAHLRPQR